MLPRPCAANGYEISDARIQKMSQTRDTDHFPVREEIREFLEYHGYQRMRELEVDDCYVRE